MAPENTMQALILRPKNRHVAVENTPIPIPGPKEILVRVRAIALNHVDWMNTANPLAGQDRRTVGSDFAGEVAQVGRDLAGSGDVRAKVGTRVAGFVQGACSVNERPGAFAEYVLAEYDLTWHVPASMPFEKAAAVSMCGLTAAQGVFARLGLPCPFHTGHGLGTLNTDGEPVNFFIYGATSSVGLYAAQLVRHAERASGQRINLLGAASASKHAMLKESPYRYDFLVDYHEPDWPSKIRSAAGPKGGVQYAFDAISQGPSVERTEATLEPNGKFAAFRTPAAGKYDMSKLKIKPMVGAVWEGLGVAIQYHGGLEIPANADARSFAASFFEYLGSDAAAGHAKLEPNPVRQMPGGLEKVVSDGFLILAGSTNGRVEDYMRPISAEKLVYII